MNTAFLLMAQYDGQAVIPVHTVARDYFPHLSADKLMRKVSLGEINLPIVRTDPKTQKGAKGVHLTDLAKYLDDRRDAAIKEAKQLASAATA